MRNWFWHIAIAGLLFWVLGHPDPPSTGTRGSESSGRPSVQPTVVTNTQPSVPAAKRPVALFVTGNRVNVRTGPGTNFGKIGQLSRGARVKEITSKDGWTEISSSVGKGWMSSKYLSSHEPSVTISTSTAASNKSENRCHSSYSGKCVPIASDVDCAGGSGNGPAYVRGPVRVVGPDVYRLDRDKDGWGCE